MKKIIGLKRRKRPLHASRLPRNERVPNLKHSIATSEHEPQNTPSTEFLYYQRGVSPYLELIEKIARRKEKEGKA